MQIALHIWSWHGSINTSTSSTTSPWRHQLVLWLLQFQSSFLFMPWENTGNYPGSWAHAPTEETRKKFLASSFRFHSYCTYLGNAPAGRRPLSLSLPLLSLENLFLHKNKQIFLKIITQYSWCLKVKSFQSNKGLIYTYTYLYTHMYICKTLLRFFSTWRNGHGWF